MILRIVRAAIRPGREEELTDAFRAVVRSALPEVPGLVRGAFGRSMRERGERVVVETLWADWTSLRDAIGPDWDRPHFFEALHDLIDDVQVEHFEIAAEYVQGSGVTIPMPAWTPEADGPPTIASSEAADPPPGDGHAP